MKKQLTVTMFGTFSLKYQDNLIDESMNRSTKLWLILAYLLYNKNTSIPIHSLASKVWDGTIPTASSLKTSLHRVRTMMDALGADFPADFILTKNGTYSLNPDVEIITDYEQFEHFYQKGCESASAEDKLKYYLKAFQLYKGEFLQRFSDTTWVTPLSTYYHNQYIKLIHAIISVCQQEEIYSYAADILKKACAVAKYEESLYVSLMRTLIHIENYKEAVDTYNALLDMLNTFSTQPSEEAKDLYSEAIAATKSNYIDIQDIPYIMNEPGKESGALYCSFDYFKEIYRVQARSTLRDDTKICLGMISISDYFGNPLPKKSLTVCTSNLIDLCCHSLRSTDVVSMCTPSQFLILLSNADEKNTQNVLKRISNKFYKLFPHTPAKLTIDMQEVEPTLDCSKNRRKTKKGL